MLGNPYAEEDNPQATLALAHEQRMATLLKFWEVGADDFPLTLISEVEKQIFVGLGFGKAEEWFNGNTPERFKLKG